MKKESEPRYAMTDSEIDDFQRFIDSANSIRHTQATYPLHQKIFIFAKSISKIQKLKCRAMVLHNGNADEARNAPELQPVDDFEMKFAENYTTSQKDPKKKSTKMEHLKLSKSEIGYVNQFLEFQRSTPTLDQFTLFDKLAAKCAILIIQIQKYLRQKYIGME